MSARVLHIDLIAFSEGAGPAQRHAVIEAAAALKTLDGVLRVVAVESGGQKDGFDLALLFLLDGFASLEPFGTDARYTRFLQGTVAPVLHAFAGADVSIEAEDIEVRDWGACLALAAPDETYDWEVRDTLLRAAESIGPASFVVGLAAGERQRYRGVVMIFTDSPVTCPTLADSRFTADAIAGRSRLL